MSYCSVKLIGQLDPKPVYDPKTQSTSFVSQGPIPKMRLNVRGAEPVVLTHGKAHVFKNEHDFKPFESHIELLVEAGVLEMVSPDSEPKKAKKVPVAEAKPEPAPEKEAEKKEEPKKPEESEELPKEKAEDSKEEKVASPLPKRRGRKPKAAK